jgi:PAS domain S-box-containing protein
MQLGMQSTMLIALKQALNGVFNVLIASIVLSYIPIRRWLKIEGVSQTISYSTIFLHVAITFLMIPLMGMLLLTNYREINARHETICRAISDEARGVERIITRWILGNFNTVKTIAELGNRYPLKPSTQLQEELKRIKALSGDFHNISLVDKDGITAAFYPPKNEKGESTIGINFSDRPYYWQLKETLQPVVSDVFAGRGGIFTAIFTLSYPVLKNGQFVGFGLGAINLERLKNLVNEISQHNELIFTILDRNDTVVISNDQNRKPLAKLEETNRSRRESPVPGVFLGIPDTKKNISIMNIWKNAFYYIRIPISGTEWILLVEYPIAPVQKYFYDTSIKNLAIVAALLLIALIISVSLSKMMARAPISLAVISRDLPGRIEKQQSIEWPETRVTEMSDLIANFVQMGDALGQKIMDVKTANMQLEDRVQERTRGLRSSEEKFRSISSSAQDAIIMMDSNGLITYWNEAAEKIFGYNPDEIIGKELHALLTPQKYYESSLKGLRLFRETGEGNAIGKTLELSALRRDGTEFPVELSLSAVFIQNNWVAIGILRDITERKLAEEKLYEINRHLEEATARANEMAEQARIASITKSEFLANMSHEIRTPMNGVIGMTGLLLDTELTEEQRRYAEVVRTSGETLLALINDILDFSKIEAKKLDLEILDFNLQAMLDDFAASLGAQAHKKGLELISSADPEVPILLRGDPGRLRQILTNLTGNAIKFTHAGEVEIHALLVEETDKDAMLRFAVRDTGIGIPEDKISVLFDKFSQIDASTTRRYGGTGLGLAISKQLTELMGGKIGVKSDEGKGSEFWFTVRLNKQENKTQREDAAPADLSGIRVLIVDDNTTNREILMTRMSSWGMLTSETRDGSSALQLLHNALEDKDPIQIIIIDMQMPGMDGETLGRIIKADPLLADTKMIMLTSLGVRGNAGLFERIGFEAYLNKPVRHQELRDILSFALAKHKETTLRPQPFVARHSDHETISLAANQKARILLAEDNITNQQVALGILRKLGISADAVANGAEALEAMKSIPYDIVLMDVQMPIMDGLEATRNIRDLKSMVLNHTVPVIAMTAHVMQGDREKCLDAGMDDYLSKPVTHQTLAAMLKKWLPEYPEQTAQEEQMTVQSHEADSPVWDKRGMLERMMNDEDLAQKIIDVFLEDIPQQIQALRTLLKTGDVSNAKRLAHSIKGASANVGGERLRAIALEIEKTTCSEDPAVAGKCLADLEREFSCLEKEILKGL